MNPTGADVAAFLGQGDNQGLVALAQGHVDVLTAMARAYTRDNGFDEFGEPNEELVAVITTAAARLVSNPSQLASEAGPFSIRGGFTGWSLAELVVLNRYRRRAL